MSCGVLIDSSYHLRYHNLKRTRLGNMVAIALFGAGGKMGYRLAKNLKVSHFQVRHVEVSDAGKQRLKTDLDLSCVDVDTALLGADVVILAVPDTAIGKVAAGISEKLKAGTMVIALDAA